MSTQEFGACPLTSHCQNKMLPSNLRFFGQDTIFLGFKNQSLLTLKKHLSSLLLMFFSFKHAIPAKNPCRFLENQIYKTNVHVSSQLFMAEVFPDLSLLKK